MNMLIAAKKVLDEISAMSDEEFETELEKHKDGDIAKALQYAWGYINNNKQRSGSRIHWSNLKYIIRGYRGYRGYKDIL